MLPFNVPFNVPLKERLHMIFMGTFIFEISTLYSLKARLMVEGKELI